MAKVQVDIVTKESGSRSVQSLGDQFKKLAGSFAMATGAAVGVGLALKGALDMAEKGAALRNLEQTFNNLAASIDTTADALLGRLREATRGMVADADLMGSANRFMSMGLAKTAEEAEKLATIAVTLGGAMGKGPTAAMEEFALMLANQSIPRLDTFGISAGQVRARIEELQAATPGLSRETAFLNAVMEQAAISMEKIGPVAENSASVIKAQFTNVINELTQTLATKFQPQLEAIAEGFTFLSKAVGGDYSQAASEAIAVTQKQAMTMDALQNALAGANDAFNLSTTSLGRLTGTSDEARQAVVDLARRVAEGSGSYEEFEARLVEAGLSADQLQYRIYNLTGTMVDIEGTFYAAAKSTGSFDRAMLIAAASSSQAAANVKELSSSVEAISGSTRVAAGGFDTLAEKTAMANNHLSESEAFALKANIAAEALAGGLDSMAGAAIRAAAALGMTAESGDAFVATLNDAEGGMGLFTESLGQMSDRLIYTSALTSQQGDDLEILTDAYDKAAKALHEYELGVRGANLTEEKRAENMGALIDTMDALAPKIAELEAVGGSYTQAAGHMTVNQDAVNQALFDAADAAGASAQELAVLAGALGLYSDEAIEAALQTALVQAKIAELAAAYVAGEIGVHGMRQALADFVAGLGETEQASLKAANAVAGTGEAALTAKIGVDELTGALGGIPTDVHTTVTADTSQAEEAISRLEQKLRGLIDDANSAGGGATGGATGGGSGGDMAAGGLVRGGIPGVDSVPTMLMPGEYVVRKNAVDKIGVDYLDNLNRGTPGQSQPGRTSAANGGSSTPVPGGITLILPNYTGDPRVMAWASVSRIGEVYGNRMK